MAAKAEPKTDEPKTLGDVLDAMPVNPPVALGVYRSISMIIDELGKVGIAKEKEATQGQKYKFRGIDQVYEALNGLLVKHNLIIVPRYTDRVVEERKTSGGNAIFNVTVKGNFDFICTLDGSKLTVTTYGEAFDVADKATSKAQSVSYKYAAFQTFCIPVEGENTDDIEQQHHEIAGRGDKGRDRQDAPHEPTKSREEIEKAARAEYERSKALLEACATEAELAAAWDRQIGWDAIPKGWHPHLVKVRQDHSKAISRPRDDERVEEPRRVAGKAPNFDNLDDTDIPF